MSDVVADILSLSSPAAEMIIFYIICAGVSATVYAFILNMIIKSIPGADDFRNKLLGLGFAAAFVFGFFSIYLTFSTTSNGGFYFTVRFLILAAVAAVLVLLEAIFVSRWITKREPLNSYLSKHGISLFIFEVVFNRLVIILLTLFLLFFTPFGRR